MWLPLLLVAALVLALLACFGVSARAPLLAIAVVCLAVAALLARGVLP